MLRCRTAIGGHMDEHSEDVGEETRGGSGGEPPATPLPSTAGEVLRGLSFAAYTASGVLAVLIMVMWARSVGDGEADFAGRYLLFLLPLLAAASALDARAKQADRTWARRRL